MNRNSLERAMELWSEVSEDDPDHYYETQAMEGNPDQPAFEPGDHCVKCDDGHYIVRVNKRDYRQFLGCSNYPVCRNTQPYKSG